MHYNCILADWLTYWVSHTVTKGGIRFHYIVSPALRLMLIIITDSRTAESNYRIASATRNANEVLQRIPYIGKKKTKELSIINLIINLALIYL